ncbi:uncharacterized protein LOC115676670 isoform X2 [Syzygium oleosum]|uniref:uncharacterized protein LOC115676670 isoform X2 n=1 Tax=Syzygium oleosum TaxID=219896 RepID=UPI0024B9B155|nr:uncharacterized protein LOC115676670 isoform X2 [Syzygium oleosum]
MPVLGESSEHTKPRRPRTQLSNPIQETTDRSPSLFVPPNRPKPTISSFLHSVSPNENMPPTMNPAKKKHFASSRFRGLGCTASASQQVSVPAVIRASADWEKRKVKKKKQKRGGGGSGGGGGGSSGGGNQTVVVDGGGSGFGGCNSGSSCVVAEDAWCGPGIGFSAADADCVVVGRRNLSARGTIDGDKFGPRERHCVSRRTVNPEEFVLESDPAFGTTHPGPETYVPGPRRYRHIRHPSPEGLAEEFCDNSRLELEMDHMKPCCWFWLISDHLKHLRLPGSVNENFKLEFLGLTIYIVTLLIILQAKLCQDFRVL